MVAPESTRYAEPRHPFPVLLPQVPGSSPLCTSSIAKLSSGLPDRLNDWSEVNLVEYVPRLNDEMCVFTKSLQALKNGGTDGRHAALRTKSFSMLFQMPMRIPSSTSRQCRLRSMLFIGSCSQRSVLTSGFPRRVVLETNLTTANAKELMTRKLSCRAFESKGIYAKPRLIRAIVLGFFHFGICNPQTTMPG